MKKEEENVFFSFVIFPGIYNERAEAAAAGGGKRGGREGENKYEISSLNGNIRV